MKKILLVFISLFLISCSNTDIIELSNDITITDGNNTIFIPKHKTVELYSCIDLGLNRTIEGSYNWRYVTVEIIDSTNIVKLTEWEYLDKFADPKYIEQIYNDCIYIGRDDLGYAFKECNKNATTEKINFKYMEIKRNNLLRQLKKHIN